MTDLAIQHIEGRVEATPLDDSNWQLLSPLAYFWLGPDGGLQRFKVPAGYVTDFASKPRFSWPIIGHPLGRVRRAAVAHDYCFTHRPRLTSGTRIGFGYSADLYHAAMKFDGVGRLQRNIEYAAVLSPFALRLWRRHDGEFVTP